MQGWLIAQVGGYIFFQNIVRQGLTSSGSQNFFEIEYEAIRKPVIGLRINIGRGLQIYIIYNSSLLLTPLGSSVLPCFPIESRDVGTSFNGMSSMFCIM